MAFKRIPGSAKNLAVGLVVLALAAPLTLAAAQSQAALRIDRVDSAAYPEVTVYVTVRDVNGVPLRDLAAPNFDVSEDRAPRSSPISRLETTVNPAQPIGVILALDTSGSMQGQPLSHAKSAAVRFLDRLAPGDRVALLAFSDAVNLEEPFPRLDTRRESDFTSDKGSLYGIVDALEARGNTSLYDAAYKATRLAARQPAGNRAVLLLSDGRDEVAGGPRGSGSRVANEDSAVREANRANVPIFTIGLGSDIDAPYLRRLAMETGGTYQETPDSAQLARLFLNVADLLKQQYRLTYRSGIPADGQPHRVAVAVRVKDNTASDEAQWTPVRAASSPSSTSLPTAVPPTAAAAVAAPAPAPTAAPAAASPAAGTASVPAAAVPTELIAIGGVAGLLALGLIGFRMTRRPQPPGPRCLQCGHALSGPGAPCPSCGHTRTVG